MKIKYHAPAAGKTDASSVAWDATERMFKLAGWCIILATLHYGYVKTNSIFFAVPEGALSSLMAYLTYTFVMRFTVSFRSGSSVRFHDGRPQPFHWPSVIAMLVVMGGVLFVIHQWVHLFLILH